MNKKVLTGLIGILLIATMPLAIAQQDTDPITVEESADIESQNIIGAAFIAGVILNPQDVGLKTEARAVLLAYYEPGLIFKDRGIATGLRTIQFRGGQLLYMNELDLGLVLVAGFVTGLNVK